MPRNGAARGREPGRPGAPRHLAGLAVLSMALLVPGDGERVGMAVRP
jgi:hypothetical protein